MTTPADRLVLYSESLLSKWGFNDGDTPDAYLDWCDTHDHPYPDDWHGILRTLVRTQLLPALAQRVELVDIETIHNPIRAERVDGVDVTGLWYRTEPGLTLTPELVEVPYADVLALYAQAVTPVTTPAPHTADDCTFGAQLLTRFTTPNAMHVCPVCGREWFVGAITPVEPESVFARFGRWFGAVSP